MSAFKFSKPIFLFLSGNTLISWALVHIYTVFSVFTFVAVLKVAFAGKRITSDAGVSAARAQY